jgi:hypothetical protein
VSGVRANFTRRPYDTSISFSVHSLLVVDAVQTFGPDFELLVASHKNLWLDTTSGSIRDSGPSSPSSPQSPISPSSPAEPVKPILAHRPSMMSSMSAAVSNALQNLISTTTGTVQSNAKWITYNFFFIQHPVPLDLMSSMTQCHLPVFLNWKMMQRR